MNVQAAEQTGQRSILSEHFKQQIWCPQGVATQSILLSKQILPAKKSCRVRSRAILWQCQSIVQSTTLTIFLVVCIRLNGPEITSVIAEGTHSPACIYISTWLCGIQKTRS